MCSTAKEEVRCSASARGVGAGDGCCGCGHRHGSSGRRLLGHRGKVEPEAAVEETHVVQRAEALKRNHVALTAIILVLTVCVEEVRTVVRQPTELLLLSSIINKPVEIQSFYRHLFTFQTSVSVMTRSCLALSRVCSSAVTAPFSIFLTATITGGSSPRKRRCSMRGGMADQEADAERMETKWVLANERRYKICEFQQERTFID